MIYLGNQAVGIVNNAPLPSFINCLDSGEITVQNGDPNAFWVGYKNIETPKGIMLYSNDFDLISAKTNKSLLGAVAAWFIAGNQLKDPDANGWIDITGMSGYAVNWGSGATQEKITNRSSHSESRGMRLLDLVNKRFYMQGFGTSEYDFKYDIVYHWIAWG